MQNEHAIQSEPEHTRKSDQKVAIEERPTSIGQWLSLIKFLLIDSGPFILIVVKSVAVFTKEDGSY